MTDTPIADAADAAVHGTAQRLSAVGHLARDLHLIGQAGEHAWPVIRAIAANPRIPELVEAALEADCQGVEAQAFEAAIDLLRGASARKAHGTGPQPAFLPAPAADGSEGM